MKMNKKYFLLIFLFIIFLFIYSFFPRFEQPDAEIIKINCILNPSRFRITEDSTYTYTVYVRNDGIEGEVEVCVRYTYGLHQVKRRTLSKSIYLKEGQVGHIDFEFNTLCKSESTGLQNLESFWIIAEGKRSSSFIYEPEYAGVYIIVNYTCKRSELNEVGEYIEFYNPIIPEQIYNHWRYSETIAYSTYIERREFDEWRLGEIYIQVGARKIDESKAELSIIIKGYKDASMNVSDADLLASGTIIDPYYIKWIELTIP